MHCSRNSTTKTEQEKGYDNVCLGVHNLTGVSKVTILDVLNHMGFVDWRDSD